MASLFHSNNTVSGKSTEAFQLTGGIYTLTTLELHTTDEHRLRQQITGMLRKAPHFFQQTPVVLDLDKLPVDSPPLHLSVVRHLLLVSGMILIAIRGGTEAQKKEASLAGTAWLPHQKKATPQESSNVVMINQPEKSIAVEKKQTEPLQPEARIISRPVRSGQQVYSDSDLIVLGQVSEGAELLAGGHIHAYGPLRGRALAGVNGNRSVRIFCNHFEAELVSIAGEYKLTGKENNNAWSQRWGRNAQIKLDEDHLQISALS